jgi:hypothetical protein
MSEQRKRPSVAFWAAVGLVVLALLYVVSFGPACWIASRFEDKSVFQCAYWPLGWATYNFSMPAFRMLSRYGGLGIPENKGLKWPLDRAGEYSTWLP